MKYIATSPCNNCPYRKDSPLQHWDKYEFEKLLKVEDGHLGSVYGCHKNNGCVCTGWLIMQAKNNFPSIMLRIDLSKNNVKRSFLDKLKCKSEMFESVKEMSIANYPELNKNANNI